MFLATESLCVCPSKAMMQLPRLSGQCQQHQQPCCLPRLHAMHGSGTISVHQQQQQQRQVLCARSQQSRTLHTVRAAAAAEQAPPAAVQADEQVCCLQALARTIKGSGNSLPSGVLHLPNSLRLASLDPQGRILGPSGRKCWQHWTVLAAAEPLQRRPSLQTEWPV